MSNAKHTPGPWWVRTQKVNGNVVDCFVAAKDVNGFAYDAGILEDDEYREENINGEPMDGLARRLADCRLIAAAPELLEALEALCKLQEDGDVVSWADEWDKALAAIAKARGE